MQTMRKVSGLSIVYVVAVLIGALLYYSMPSSLLGDESERLLTAVAVVFIGFAPIAGVVLLRSPKELDRGRLPTASVIND